MPKLKRDVVKYVRDKAKSKYEKGTACGICGETEQLDFHHFYSLTPLLNQWLTKNTGSWGPSGTSSTKEHDSVCVNGITKLSLM